MNPASGSVLTAQGLEPILDSVSPSLSAPPLLALKFFLIKKFFFYIYLFLRDRERQSMSRGGEEREGDTESSAGSRL